MYQFFLVIFLIIAIALIILIMLQQNNNSSGGMFDNRSLGDIFNVRPFNDGVTRLIAVLAILFFVFSLLLGNMNSKHNKICIHDEYQEKIKR